MSAHEALRGIAVKVDGEVFTMNVQPLLHEVRHALQRLLDTGEETAIDLRSLPLAPGELEQIDARLGTGEVQVHMNALGPSAIRETRFSGVWRVTHRNAGDEIVAEFIEITRIPALLFAQEPDMRSGLESLSRLLEGGDG